jgi:glutamate N-acetyltransferase/amino-acid N-acetyltransferase
VAMAIGKSTTADEVDQSKVVICFGNQEVYPTAVDDAALQALAAYMRGSEVRIVASLAAGQSSATVWGCDLTDGYVRINADYTT